MIGWRVVGEKTWMDAIWTAQTLWNTREQWLVERLVERMMHKNWSGEIWSAGMAFDMTTIVWWCPTK